MSRNSNTYFSETPARVDLPRSTINRNQEHKTTFNAGELIPFYVDEVLPGSTHNIKTAMVVRMQTLLNPIMDNLFLDTYYFFVPNRIVWDHWQEFCGENKTGAWTQEVEYSIPQLANPVKITSSPGYAAGWDKGSIADYMGIPTDIWKSDTSGLNTNFSVNALPFRGYAEIANEFFRDQNLMDPLNIPTGDSDVIGYRRERSIDSNGKVLYSSLIDAVAAGGHPFPVCKTHDYFTSCLPAPQKTTEPIAITLGAALDNETVPVIGNGDVLGLDYGTTGKLAAISSSGSSNNVKATTFTDSSLPNVGSSTAGGNFTDVHNLGLSQNGSYSGVIADLDSIADNTLITINQLRQAFQVQKFYERQAYSGSRYREILKSMFGVTSPDARMQIPEYLGGKRIPIAINQVVQTSETGSTPQGNVAAYSVTSDLQHSFSKSFVEHGYIIGVMCVRYNHTYQSGVERFWSRKSKFDFYWPLFANLSNQPVLKKEIFANGTSSDDDVFGYQEAWADYRYKPNRVSGEFRSNYSASLDSWHLADDYVTTVPTLSEQWILEDGATIDRVLAVSQRVSDQFLADIYIENKTTQPMPVYSIPGLVDHH